MNIKRKAPVFQQVLKKRRLNIKIEEDFEKIKPGDTVGSADRIPMRIIRVIRQCVKGKESNGRCDKTERIYRNFVRDWLTGVWTSGQLPDRDTAIHLLNAVVQNLLTPNDLAKLRLLALVQNMSNSPSTASPSVDASSSNSVESDGKPAAFNRLIINNTYA